MKIEEIEVLRNLQEYLQNKIDVGCHKLNYNDLMHDFKVVDAISSIETILQELKHLQKNNEELMNEYHKRVQERIDIEQELKDSISKDKIREIITKTEKHLKGISKRREKAKTPEEESVLWCLEIRLDERIRTLQDLEQRR